MAQTMRVQKLTPEQKADKLMITARVGIMLLFERCYDDTLPMVKIRSALRDIHNDVGKARKAIGEPYDMAEDHD